MSKYFKGHQCQMTNRPNKIFQLSKQPSEKQTRDIMQTNDVTLIFLFSSHQREAITCLMNCYLFPEETLPLLLEKICDASQLLISKKN